MRASSMFPYLLIAPALIVFSVAFLSTDPLAGAVKDDSEIVFSHLRHGEDAGLECASCHGNAAKSGVGTDDLMPEKDTCSECHDVEDPESCGSCHRDVGKPAGLHRVVAYNPLFPHAKHAGGAFSCEQCHRGISKSEKAGDEHLPGMKMCVDCHRERGISDGCNTCHEKGGKLKPTDHGSDFIHSHGRMTVDREHCTLCHRSQVFCIDCHNGDNLSSGNPHPLNYLHRHGIEARHSDAKCETCHPGKRACNDCHRASRVKPHTHSAGWFLSGSGGRHASAGRRNLETCISCHSDAKADPICIRCHQ